ncbi:hypothetical protein SDC49_08715 [Lactobacillus sp. R2/2]|nr:hypothetical protein [Lactobacillus sp. R2/2]
MNQAQEQRVNLEITPDSNLPQKIVTEQLNLDLIKILGNLIDNSLAAIKDSGKITLAINFDSESSVLIIEVADTGTGISSEVKSIYLNRSIQLRARITAMDLFWCSKSLNPIVAILKFHLVNLMVAILYRIAFARKNTKRNKMLTILIVEDDPMVSLD